MELMARECLRRWQVELHYAGIAGLTALAFAVQRVTTRLYYATLIDGRTVHAAFSIAGRLNRLAIRRLRYRKPS
jgi:hypothetical protein